MRWSRAGGDEFDHLDQVGDQQPPMPVRVAAGALAQPVEEPGAGRRGGRVAAQPGAEVGEQAGGHLQVAGHGGGADHRESGGGGAAADLAEQAGLADPRLAGQQEQLAGAGGGFGVPAPGEVQLVAPSDQDGTGEGHSGTLGAAGRLPRCYDRCPTGRRRAR
nr:MULTISPECIES: hypothetical protein [unclassified Actinoplanes]